MGRIDEEVPLTVAREAGTRGHRGESKNVIMGIMAKVVIVGGAGYVGVALTDLLFKTDHQVRVYEEAFEFAPKRGWDGGCWSSRPSFKPTESRTSASRSIRITIFLKDLLERPASPLGYEAPTEL